MTADTQIPLDTPMPKRLSQSALGRELGVSRQAVHDLLKRGVLTSDSDGLIDLETAIAALERKVHPVGKTAAAVHAIQGKTTEGLQGEQTIAELLSVLQEPLIPPKVDPAPPPASSPPSVDTEDLSYHEAKTLREIAEAKIAEHKLGEMQGALVARDRVESAVFEATRALRDGLTNCSRRVSAEVAPLISPAACEEVISREHRQLLIEFARGLRQMLGPPPSAGGTA